jgi:hypothetical protein
MYSDHSGPNSHSPHWAHSINGRECSNFLVLLGQKDMTDVPRSAGAAGGLFDAFLSGSLIAPAQRRLNCTCVKRELTQQDNGAEHVCMVSSRLIQAAADD